MNSRVVVNLETQIRISRGSHGTHDFQKNTEGLYGTRSDRRRFVEFKINFHGIRMEIRWFEHVLYKGYILSQI